MAATLLACDWGTSKLRAWVLDEGGRVLSDRDFDLGVSRLQPGEAETRFLGEIRPGMDADDLPAILCGMIGSNLGWRAIPYADCPATLADLAGGLAPMDAPGPAVTIVPGLRCRTRQGGADVMRGEETQVFGWLAADPVRQRGRQLVCHPGTHPKWVLIEDGRVARFQTAMTGELFEVLRKHSVLKDATPPDNDAAFAAGVEAAGDGDALSARLFSARARVVGDGRPAEETSSYLSGLLIGAELAGAPRLLGAGDLPIALLGDPTLCAIYQRAFAARGTPVASIDDGEAAAVAGLFALHTGRTGP